MLGAIYYTKISVLLRNEEKPVIYTGDSVTNDFAPLPHPFFGLIRKTKINAQMKSYPY